MPRAARLGEVDGPHHRLDMARHHDLPRRIVVGGFADLALGSFGGDLNDGVEIEPEQRRHRADSRGDRRLHRIPAQPQQPRCVGQRQRSRRDQRCIFAQRMPGDERCFVGEPQPAFDLQHTQRGDRHRHDRRLGVGGQRQFVVGTVPHQREQLLAERVIDLFENGAGGRAGVGKAGAHARRLAALARKDESADDVYSGWCAAGIRSASVNRQGRRHSASPDAGDSRPFIHNTVAQRTGFDKYRRDCGFRGGGFRVSPFILPPAVCWYDQAATHLKRIAMRLQLLGTAAIAAAVIAAPASAAVSSTVGKALKAAEAGAKSGNSGAAISAIEAGPAFCIDWRREIQDRADGGLCLYAFRQVSAGGGCTGERWRLAEHTGTALLSGWPV